MKARAFLAAALAIAALLVGSADAQNGGNGKPASTFIKPLGYCQFQVSGTATTLANATPTSTTTCAVPQRAAWISGYVESNAVRTRDDGTAPTATVGQPVPVGPFFYNSNLNTISFISQTGTATIDISFYDGPGLP